MGYTEQALNRLSLMQAIGSRGPISRTELTGALHLSSATITELTADLVRRGLIRERKDAARRSGRPRIQLEINPDGAIVVGTSLAPDGTLAVTFINLAGIVLRRWNGQLKVDKSLPKFVTTLADRLEEAIGSTGYDRTAISRIAIGLPALVDSERGVIEWMATMDGAPLSAGTEVEKRTGIPVTVESGGIGMARAERWFGRARDLPDFLLVNLDITVNATQVASGVPTRGAHGLNMEFMHTKVASVENGRPCYCRARGCLAAYSSVIGILAAANEAEPVSIPPLRGEIGKFGQMLERARAGDPAAARLFDIAGQKLGIAIGNLVNMRDPGHVIVLSSDQAFCDLIEPALRRSFQQAAHPALHRITPLDIGTTAPGWEELGMAALALEQTFLSGGRGVKAG